MEGIFDYFRYNKSQVLIISGFLLTLISIPVSFTLVKDSQIFRSRASEINPTPIAQIDSSTLTQVPDTSPLEELKKLSDAQPLENAPTTDTTPTNFATSFGPTLSFKVTLEGRPVTKNGGRFFMGIAPGSKTTKPTYLLTFNLDVPDSGVVSGVSLAGLSPGTTYTVYLKGPSQIDAASTFTMTASENALGGGAAIPLISGDLNEDNTINTSDYNLAKAAYGATSSSSKWSPKADINLDGIINNIDLVIINSNQGKTGDSGVWYSPPPVASSSGTPVGGPDQRGGFWLYLPPVD
jgi:hypothetical protein